MSSTCVATHHLLLPRRLQFDQQQASSGPLICSLSSISFSCFETKFWSGARLSTGRVLSRYAAVLKGNGWSETLSPALMFGSGNRSDGLFSGQHLCSSSTGRFGGCFRCFDGSPSALPYHCFALYRDRQRSPWVDSDGQTESCACSKRQLPAHTQWGTCLEYDWKD